MCECDKNWETCGYCVASFDGPFNSVRPVCRKAGFYKMFIGDVGCPTAPDPDSSPTRDDKAKRSQFIFSLAELDKWLADGNIAKSVEKLDADKYLVTRKEKGWWPC